MPRVLVTPAPVKSDKRVFIATPATSLHGNYVFALAQSLPRLALAGIAADYMMLLDNCHVDDGRNACVREFLKSDAEALIFIDADVGWRPEDLIALIGYDRDLVAGVYPLKQPDEEGYPIRMKPGAEIWSDEDGLVEAEGLPTGFLKISRRVIEAMVETHKDRKFWGRGQDQSEPPHYILFERTFDNGVRYSGDYAFCMKAQALGFKMYVDPMMVFSHEGAYEWGGCLGDYWKRAHGVKASEDAAKFDAAIAALKSGNPEPEAFVDLFMGWGNSWAAQPDLLAACWDLAKGRKTILETGSGLTTLVLAMAEPSATIHALESDPIWATKTRDALVKHGITNVVLHCHDLKDYGGYRWYDDSGLPDVSFDLVLCDGPKRSLGSRKGLFDRLGDRLGVVVMDDADDSAQLATLKEWAGEVHTMGEGRVFAIGTKGSFARAAE